LIVMGLLDEAIREHLDLKRRHGADPGEVARLEHEALGPVRRQAEEPASVAGEEEAGGAVATASAPAENHAAPEPERAETTASEREVEQPTQHLSEVEQPTQHLEAHEAAGPAETVAPRQDEPGERAIPAEDPEAEEIVAADEEPDADDVLEETPEFLQQTPEHERLWFEQKPPRDFDF
jgi:hypothetical protein